MSRATARDRGRVGRPAYYFRPARDTIKRRPGEGHDELGRRLRAEGRCGRRGGSLAGKPRRLGLSFRSGPQEGIARAAALLAARIGSGPDGPPAAGVEAGPEPMHDAHAERPLEYRRAAPPRGGSA
jgi:hypothetical protein